MLKYKNWYMLQEKTLSDSEIEDLIDKSQKGVQRVIGDTDRDESERKQVTCPPKIGRPAKLVFF